MADRPGVVLYFGDRPAIQLLSSEEKALLLDALMDYGEFGLLPEFANYPRLAVCWEFIRQKIDRDREKYKDKCFKNRYAVFIRERRKQGVHEEDIPSFEEWLTYTNDIT